MIQSLSVTRNELPASYGIPTYHVVADLHLITSSVSIYFAGTRPIWWLGPRGSEFLSCQVSYLKLGLSSCPIGGAGLASEA